ncbi:MAG: Hsp20/alpha crystallin family protein [Deltaproteobacteria bacterium]|nr:Hsp20/alpha crystallin family protein [Deltaproteobacteria bacterium]
MSARKDIIKREEGTERVHHIPTAAPLVDIYENDEEILLYADMPGVVKDGIRVNIDNGKLALSGERKLVANGAANWEEFGDVEYSRIFSVPQAIDVNRVNAELKDGVLHLHLPKSEAAKPRQIEIKAG